MKIMKFGGGCLKDRESFLKVSSLIAREKEVIVVVSAIQGMTDLLLKSMEKALEGEDGVRESIEEIRKRHFELAEQITKNKRIKEKILREIEARIKTLERNLYGICYTGEVFPPVKALILSYGERFSAFILTGTLLSQGRMAKALESEKAGIITDENFENASPILSEVKKKLELSVVPLVKKGEIPVITGYFGCTSQGKITTLGRNGSDYSASVIGSALGAEVIEIWKDVEGFMSADPGIVKKALKIERLSYPEAAELSYFGAKILHPRTFEPLSKRGIPIYIKYLQDPLDYGTLISPDSEGRENHVPVKSVTYNRHISVLKVYGAGVGYKPGIIAEIGRRLAEQGINIYSIITSQTCINLILKRSDARKSQDLLKTLVGGVIERVDLEEQKALIAVIGEGILKKKGIAARIFSSVTEAKINIQMVSGGASDVTYYIVVEEGDFESAVVAIHREFFEEEMFKYKSPESKI